MKKKLLILFLVVITCIACLFGIAACNTDKPDNGGQGTVQTPPEEKPNDTEKPSENKPNENEKPSVVEVTGVTLNKTTLALEVDGTETLTATVLPSNATDKTVTWKSSDSSVAKVENGKITALKAGTAMITAICGSESAVCTVAVNNKDFIGVVLDSQAFTYDGGEKRLAVKNAPSGAKVVYEGNGKIDAGIYTVSATISMDGYNSKELSATLTINKDVLNNITFMGATYKYDGTEKSLTVQEILPEGVSVSYENNGKTNAGSYLVKAVFTVNNNYEEIQDMTATLKIEKAVIDDITFNDLKTVYDGTKKFIEVSGKMPDEVTVEYIGNGKITVGDYTVTAIFDCKTDNYIIPDDMTATLTIRKAIYDMSEIGFENKAFTYDGTEKSLNITGDLPEGVTVSYENNIQINAGQYFVTAKFIGDNINYYTIDEMQAVMTINKGNYNMSGTSFTGARFVYDGTPKSIYLTGELPDGITVNYSGNGKVNAGSYTVTASFTGDSNNYNKISDRSVSMIIDKAEYDMSEIKFENKTFIYDGTNKSIAISGSLPTGVTVAYYGNECVNVGQYPVTATFIGDTINYNLIEDMSAKITINKAVPYIAEVKCNQTLNLYSTIELIAETDVAGTVSFDEGQKLQLGFKNYRWTFIPEDKLNYTEVTGQTGLTVCALVTYYDGEAVFTAQNIIVNNSAYIPENVPTKEDYKGLRYTFSHWSIEQSGTEFDYTTAITEDLNLYAVYDSEEIVYSVFYYNTADAENTNITQFTVSTQKNLYSIQRDYYTFDGWYDNEGAKVNKIQAGTFGNIKLYAHWTPIEYAITYNSKYKAQNSNSETYNVESEFNFAEPVYDEYHIFEGWFADEDFTEEVTAVREGEYGEKVLYAKWNFTGTFVSTATQLKSVAYNMSGAYELSCDITVTEADDWVKIGDNNNPFVGYFNGAGFTVTVELLFGTSNGKIQNINIQGTALGEINNENGYIYNCHSTGYLLEQNSGTVVFCSGQNGFVRINNADAVIRNSYATGGYLTYTKGDYGYRYMYLGGLVACNNGMIEKSFYKGNIKAENCFIPIAKGSYSACYNYFYVGGLVGGGDGSLKYCYSKANVEFIQNKFTPDNSVSGDPNFNYYVYVGVFAGSQNNAEYCYATGEVGYTLIDLYPDSRYTHYSEGVGIFLNLYNSGFGEFKNLSNSFSSITYGDMSYPTQTNNKTINIGNTTVTVAYEQAKITHNKTGAVGTNCYSSSSTNVTNLLSRDFIIEKLGWSEYIDEKHISDGNVWILENGQYPKLWFEV